jgi:iron complex outermembrane recepter protein
MSMRITSLCLAAGCVGTLLWCSPLNAQDTGTGARTQSDFDEIIVTARKRQESLLNAPVIETAITQQQLSTLQTVDVSDLTDVVPGVVVGHSQGPVGLQVSIRGVGSISADQGVDSSVSLNIDGLSISNGVAFESGLFDLQQMEVLKGPQDLFYGKSSTGGVISLRTADPTDKLEVIGRESYEFEAQTTREEAIISGPVSDTLKLRLAAMYSASQGYFYNQAVAVPDTGAVTPTDSRAPNAKDYIIRGTALWDPNSQLSVRLKLNVVGDTFIYGETAQLADCPEGANFAPFGIAFTGGDNCRLDRTLRVVYMDPADFPGIGNNGVPSVDNRQRYATLDSTYHLIDGLDLTSTTGYYHLDQATVLNATNSTAAGPALGVNVDFHRNDLTEEVRLNSDFHEPVNFTLGGYYEDGYINNNPVLIGNIAYGLPPLFSNVREIVGIKTWSAFGQARWQIVPNLEWAVGVRWTDEGRDEFVTDYVTGTPTAVPVAIPRLRFVNSAPETTLSYKPTEDITIFASYKEAYKSGSYGLGGVPTPGSDSSFGDEKAQGKEVGFKTRMFDHQLAIDAAAYYYHYSGLQVGAIEPAETSGLVVTQTLNAGAARSYGIDLDTSFRPRQIDGLTLRAAANWNLARYLVLSNVPCWGGQTIAAGCNQLFDAATGLYTAQNLAGTPMIRAPDAQANIGFDYEFPIGRGLTMVLANSNSFSSRFATFLAVGRPNDDQYQGSYFKSDVSVSLQGQDDRWEIGLIAKNINDKIIATNCNSSNYAGGAVFGGQITGGTGAGPAGIDQVACNTSPGRELWLRLQAKY